MFREHTMNNLRTSLFVFAVILSGCATTPNSTDTANLSADVRLAPLFTDHMVLQRDMKIPVWGWAAPGDLIKVSLANRTATAKADQDGKWMARLAPLPAGGPHTLTVTGKNTITLNDVLVGDVWLASGQSNMWWPLRQGDWGVLNRDAEIAAANYPQMRFVAIPPVTSFTPKDHVETAGWLVCSPETAPGFSGVAYFFARDMHQATGVPIGMIQSSWGGTICEAWASEDALRELPDFKVKLDQMDKDAPNIPKAEADYQQAVAKWNADLANHDKGHQDGNPIWAAPELDMREWRTATLPGVWEKAGYEDLDGFMWYRKVVEVPAEWAGKDLTLSLGIINDMDRTWFNGTLVGKNEGPQSATVFRNYSVPGSAVVAGPNVIAVRVYDMANVGGICGTPEDMYLSLAGAPDADKISLAGEWNNRPSAYLRDIPPQPAAPLLREGDPNVPGVLFNAMINPLVPYGLKGAIWYQGESNAGRAFQYRELFPAMIADWRAQWGQGDFPFLFVQLANFMPVAPEPGPSAWAELREAQLMTLKAPKTGMATIIDIGEADDIHPQNKQDVGRRLALWARHYDGEKLVYSGPLYASHSIEGNAVRIRFNHTGSGLKTPDGAPLKGFAIAGADKKFVWAEARIEGDSVVVSSASVLNPQAVRYAWADNPVCNLYNSEGLSASPFRTDTWPGVTDGNK
jgi:sialate O-acetylesterase